MSQSLPNPSFLVKVAQKLDFNDSVGENQPLLYLFSAVLHCRPLLLHLNHQTLKQPLLIL